MADGERMEHLGGGVRAIVSPAHTFGADAILLAHFSAPVRGRVCDLGTGCGIIPLLWCAKGIPRGVDAFEIQPEAAGLASRAAALNGFDIRVHCADFREIGREFLGLYDLVACNPPYFRAGAAQISRSDAAAAARHEVSCTLADVVEAGARLLKPGGRLCLCLRPERLPECMTLLRQADLEPKRLRLVQQNAHAKPWLALVEGRRGGRPGLAVPAALLMEEDGRVSQEMRDIYGNYDE